MKFLCNVFYTCCATVTVEADDIQQAMETAKDKADNMPSEQLSLVAYTDTQAEPIVRKFEEDEVVFVNDIWEPDLRGFGKILVAEETTEE